MECYHLALKVSVLAVFGDLQRLHLPLPWEIRF